MHSQDPMSWSEEKQRKEGWRKKIENNKNHQLKLVLVKTKQTRLSQTLLPYEVFAFTSVNIWLESAYSFPDIFLVQSKHEIISIWKQIVTVIWKEKKLVSCPSLNNG